MTPLEQASAILKAAEEASTAPWKLDTTQNLGDNWMIGTLLWVGSDEDKDGQFSDYIVTTDRVRASEFTGQGPQADAAFIALREAGALIEWRPIEEAPEGVWVRGWSKKDGQRDTYLTTYQKGSIGYVEGRRDKWWEWHDGEYAKRWNPTHWQPMPTTPGDSQ